MSNTRKFEAMKRSVMPLDVLGCTRATMVRSASVWPNLEGLGSLCKRHRDRDGSFAIIAPQKERGRAGEREGGRRLRPFPSVHTAHRSNGLSYSVSKSECSNAQLLSAAAESLVNLIT